MKSKLFILFLVIMLPSEVWAQRAESAYFLKKYYSYHHPKSKFRFAKKHNVAALKALKVLPIDTNAVYSYSRFDSYINDTLYGFIRFFSGGEVFISHYYKSYPAEQEFNDLSYGSWAMYAVKGNDLIIERYVKGLPPQYWYIYAKVEGNKIRYYKSIIGRCNKETELINGMRERKAVNLTNFKINWQ